MSFTMQSPAFKHEQPIPKRCTCEGEDVSPPLTWTDVPHGTKSLVLIVDDPDAPDPRSPRMVFVHWIVLDLPPDTRGLPEDARASGLPDGASEGRNDFGRTGWGGPCPPIGRHRYFFRLYALDAPLALGTPGRADVDRAMEGHVLGQTELMGTYQKK